MQIMSYLCKNKRMHFIPDILISSYPVFFFSFQGHTWEYIEVPRLGVESKPQLPTSPPAVQDRSPVCDLHHSSWQCQILNPLSGSRDWTHILMYTNWVLSPLSHNRNSSSYPVKILMFSCKYCERLTTHFYLWHGIICSLVLHVV